MLPLNVAPVVHEADLLLSKETTWVYWIMVNLTDPGTIGTVKVYDGWDDKGVERMRVTAEYSRLHVFIPPIRCQDALFVTMEDGVASYVVGWRTEASLPKE